MAYNYDRTTRTAAVEKAPLFGKFETTISLQQIEALVSKHYKLVPGSLKIKKGDRAVAQRRVHQLLR